MNRRPIIIRNPRPWCRTPEDCYSRRSIEGSSRIAEWALCGLLLAVMLAAVFCGEPLR